MSVVKFGGYGAVEVSFKLSIPGFDGAVLLRKDYIIPRWGGLSWCGLIVLRLVRTFVRSWSGSRLHLGCLFSLIRGGICSLCMIVLAVCFEDVG